jgi:FkbM family methyltransferase
LAVRDDPDLLVTADLDATSVVVDGGAYLGEWCAAVAERYHPVIHAYEPSPAALPQLDEVARQHGGIEVHPFALGRADGPADLHLGGPGSSTFGPAVEGRTTTVELRDVATAFDALDVAGIDLLKLNIEGGEYDVLDRLLETGWLERIRLVSVQFHEWHPNAYRRRRRIRRALRATHDEVWCYPWVWELWQAR